MTHICVSKLTIIGSDNGLSPGRRQAMIWTKAGILVIGPLATNFSEILIGIHIFSFKIMQLKMLSAKCGPFCLNLNVLISKQWIWSSLLRHQYDSQRIPRGRLNIQIDGLAQDYSNSSTLALELLQSCAKPSTCCLTETGKGTMEIRHLMTVLSP